MQRAYRGRPTMIVWYISSGNVDVVEIMDTAGSPPDRPLIALALKFALLLHTRATQGTYKVMKRATGTRLRL